VPDESAKPDQPRQGNAKQRVEFFPTTQVSLILRARDPSPAVADAAVEELCEIYNRPVLNYAKYREKDEERAKDLTQEFLLDFYQKRLASRYDPTLGRFRNYLIACFNHLNIEQIRHDNAQRRGAGRVVSLDAYREAVGESGLPSVNSSAMREFDRQCAFVLIERAVQRLKQEYIEADKEAVFKILRPFLTKAGQASDYEQLGLALGKSAGAAKVEVHRLRNRYRLCFREEVGKTVHSEAELDEELNHFRSIMGPLDEGHAPHP
jgi:RNA polymerase sigma factor (sigma-70 family)